MGGVRHFIPGHQGQVQKQGKDRQRRGEDGHRGGVILHPCGHVGGGVDAHSLDPLGGAGFDAVDTVLRGRGVVLQGQHIPCPQMLQRGWQGQTQAVTGQARLGQPAFDDLTALGAGQQQRDVGGGDGMGRLVGLDGFFGHGGIGGIGLHEAQADAACHLGLGFAVVLGMGRAVGQIGERRGVDGLRHRVAAHDKAQTAVAFHRVEAVGQHQRLQRAAGVRDLRQHIAAHDPVKLAGVGIGETGAGADLVHHRGERAGGEPSRHPMAARDMAASAQRAALAGKNG